MPDEEEGAEALELLEQVRAAEEAEERAKAFIGERKARKKAITRSQFAGWTREMEGFMASQEWDDAEPKHFVALYAWLYRKVYGFDSALLSGGEEAARACGGAKRGLSEFAGDASEFAAYMRWLWTREAAQERWRRENKQEGRVMSWHLSFAPKMVVEYRIQKARTRR